MYNFIYYILPITIGIFTLLVGIYQAYNIYKFYKVFLDHLDKIDKLREEGYQINIL